MKIIKLNFIYNFFITNSMDYKVVFGLLFLGVLIGLIACNYKIMLANQESFMNQNNFTNSQCCCSQKDIDKCNSWGKSCVCDYFDKNKHFCQAYY